MGFWDGGGGGGGGGVVMGGWGADGFLVEMLDAREISEYC